MNQLDLTRQHEIQWRLGRRRFDYVGVSPAQRGLLVGEAPGPNTNSKLPLFPEPTNSAAGRLLKYAGVPVEDYMGKLVRVNLCRDNWSDREAAGRRVLLTSWLLDRETWYEGAPLRVLLLGTKVAKAWSASGPFGYDLHVYPGDVEVSVAWIPHPSGRCHLYNQRANQLRARRAVLWALGERKTP